MSRGALERFSRKVGEGKQCISPGSWIAGCFGRMTFFAGGQLTNFLRWLTGKPFSDNARVSHHRHSFQLAFKNRCRNRSNFARPNICRLINLSRLTCPSVCPLLQRRNAQSSTPSTRGVSGRTRFIDHGIHRIPPRVRVRRKQESRGPISARRRKNYRGRDGAIKVSSHGFSAFCFPRWRFGRAGVGKAA